MKRKNGHIILDEYQETQLINNNSSHNIYLFNIKDKYYYFKECEYIFKNYGEVFASLVAKEININTVDYDLAIYKGNYGTISNSFNPKENNIITINSILKKYYEEIICNNENLFPNEMFISNANNLETIWWSLEYYYKDSPDKNTIVKNLMQDIVDSFILQIILGNGDLHGGNLYVIEDKKIKLGPNFDYGDFATINVTTDNYYLNVTPLKFNEKNSAKQTIKSFLSFSNDGYERLKEKIELLPPFEILVQKLENKIKIKTPDSIKTFLESWYQENFLVLKDIINEHRKNR